MTFRLKSFIEHVEIEGFYRDRKSHFEVADFSAQPFSSYVICTVYSLVVAVRPQTMKHIRAGWSHYTDTSEPVDGNGARNMVIIQSEFQTRDLSITGPTHLPTALTITLITYLDRLVLCP
jgi:hypothetical protein